MLRVNERCTFYNIEIGEVFTLEGCWAIAYKVDDTHIILLDVCKSNEYECDQWIENNRDKIGKTIKQKTDEEAKFFLLGFESYYKLPLSVQRLWKEE